MATYYVKNGGNDGLDGLSDGNAWATISKVNGASGQATVTDFASGKAGYFGYGSEYDAGATNWEGGDL
jgi:hypothetical protein